MLFKSEFLSFSGNELVSFPLDSSLPLPSAFPDLSDLMSPENPVPSSQPSFNQEEEDYIQIDPMSFVNLPGQESSSKSDK